MKKVLFYSVAFAAALASCTQEEVFVDVTAGNDAQDLSIRPTLGEVVLTEDAGAVTRFAAGSGAQAKFEENDQLGALIADKPLYTNAANYEEMLEAAEGKAADLYAMVNYYSSNSAFTYDGSAWWLNKDMPLVEGNYVFYAPYNKEMQLRSAMTVMVPETQDASEEKSALNQYYNVENKNVVKVGHQFLAYNNGKAQKPQVTMHDIMAYPVFTIENNFKGFLKPVDNNVLKEFNGGDIKITKIEIINGTDADMVIGGQLSNANIATTVHGQWAETPFENFTVSVLGDEKATVAADGVITTLEVNRVIAQGASAQIYAVLPAVRVKNEELKAKVYAEINGKPYLLATNASYTGQEIGGNGSNKNDYKESTFNSCVVGNSYSTATGTLTLLKGQRYPQEEMNFDGKSLSAKKIAGNALTLKLTNDNLVKKVETTTGKQIFVEQPVEVVTPDQPETPVVTDYIDNNAEFIAYFKELENGTALIEDPELEGFKASTSTTPQFRFSEDNTVVINSELIDALSLYNNKGTLTLVSALPIADDVTVAVASGNKVTFTSANDKSYEITLGAGYTVSENSVVSAGKSIIVLKEWTSGAETTTGNIIVYKNAVAEVAHTITANSFVNNGTLVAKANALFVNGVTNNGTINLESSSVKYLKVTAGNGTINLSKGNIPNTNNFNVESTATQKGVYTTTTVDKKPFAWVSEIIVNSAIENLTAEDIETLGGYVKATVAGGVIKYTHSGMASYNWNINTALIFTADLTIVGMDKDLTTVNGISVDVAQGAKLILKNVSANGSNVGKGSVVTDKATWNGKAAGAE